MMRAVFFCPDDLCPERHGHLHFDLDEPVEAVYLNRGEGEERIEVESPLEAALLVLDVALGFCFEKLKQDPVSSEGFSALCDLGINLRNWVRLTEEVPDFPPYSEEVMEQIQIDYCYAVDFLDGFLWDWGKPLNPIDYVGFP
ncbi:MAG: hypothetical protein KKH88_00235 [Nanoarchaeota archaeon]|nr:hypothetical protein [Nanoarchaeota archaeon]MBU1445462.1 hypothetical protein [Nanoarchaeota archaeon]MBU2420664.1 hypothetical protein [Nanoarchaeota archaeon]MBU2475401.1 hypothetical protein [Nanoarchaeota archaeon]MBU3940345.1 hypothetical protein [Nanoarchaeota archaeon]